MGFGDVWFTFTAPSAGCYHFETPADATLKLALLDACHGNFLVCDFAAQEGTSGSSLFYPLASGQNVVVLVRNVTESVWTTTLTVSRSEPPTNDLCSNATVVSLGATPFNNHCAGTEAITACANGPEDILPSQHDVWFRFTAPATQTYLFNTCSMTFATTIAVYNTCPTPGGAVSEIKCNEYGCNRGANLFLQATVGQTYLIRVAGIVYHLERDDGQGFGVLNISTPLPNETCAGALPVHMGRNVVSDPPSINNRGFACENGDGQGPDLFFVFTAPQSGDYQFSSCNIETLFFSTLALISPDCGDELDCSGSSCPFGARLIRFLSAGEQCIVQWDSFSDNTGTGILDIDFIGDQYATYSECESSEVFVPIASSGTKTRFYGSSAANVPIGFNFKFFGIEYNSCWAGVYGPVSFGIGSDEYQNTPIPHFQGHGIFGSTTHNFCAAWWGRIEPAFDEVNSWTYTKLAGAAPYRTFTISWENVPYWGGRLQSFQVVLHETTNAIEFVYGDITPYRHGRVEFSVGCENGTGSAGIQIPSILLGTGNTARLLVPSGTPCPPVCPADFNHVGGVTVQDIFDFLAAWFAASPDADFNHAGGVSVQDIFDFLSAWFAGC